MLVEPFCLPPAFQHSDLPSKGAEMADFWTFEAVEDRMVEAMRFAWRDEPGNWPFAGDGPWHLIQREVRLGDYDARGGDMEAPPLPRIPLTREERARMMEATGWLSLLSDARVHPVRVREAGGACDARLIILATRKLAAKRGAAAEGAQKRSIRWSQLLRPMGIARGAGMLSKRYGRALGAIVRELDRQGVPVVLAKG